MKKMVLGFILGCIMATTVSVFAASVVATANIYKVTVNGKEAAIDGYNIDGSTYFKLRDVADAVGGFSVAFENNTIAITTNAQRPAEQNQERGQAGTPMTLEDMKANLEQEVKDGKMTQEQAGEMLARFQAGEMQPPNRGDMRSANP